MAAYITGDGEYAAKKKEGARPPQILHPPPIVSILFSEHC